MTKVLAAVIMVSVLCFPASAVRADEDKPGLRDLFSFKQTTKGLTTVVGILTDVASMTITIRTPEGKEITYMRGLGLELPPGVQKSSLVTLKINEKLGVVKSISPTVDLPRKPEPSQTAS